MTADPAQLMLANKINEMLGVYTHFIWGDLEKEDRSSWLVFDHQKNTAHSVERWLAN